MNDVSTDVYAYNEPNEFSIWFQFSICLYFSRSFRNLIILKSVFFNQAWLKLPSGVEWDARQCCTNHYLLKKP